MSRDRRTPRGHDFYMDVWHRRDSLQRFVGRQRADWMSQIGNDILYFIVTDALTEQSEPEKSPLEYAEWLWSLRFEHWRSECTNPAKSRMLAWRGE